MHRVVAWGLIGVGAVLLSGCRTFTNPGEVKQVYINEAGDNSLHRISWDATRRGTYVIRKTGTDDKPRFYVVSEPPPDAALETISKLTGKLTVGADASGSGEASSDITETIKALTRSIEISFLREALFRLSEGFANDALTAEQYSSHMHDIIRLTTMMVLADSSKLGGVDGIDWNLILTRLLGRKQEELREVEQAIKDLETSPPKTGANMMSVDEIRRLLNERKAALQRDIEKLEAAIAAAAEAETP